jgi:hypothetical protein
LTLSNGKYQEFHDLDSIVQIGTTLINVNSRKIVGFVKKDSANSIPDASVSSRFISVDPLAHQYYNLSPYNFVANNPIRYIDPDGREIVAPQGKKITITYNKDGSLSFSKNATEDVKRVANALNLTETGRSQLKKVEQSRYSRQNKSFR